MERRSSFEKDPSFCIHCGLCVRYCNEIKKLNAVGFVDRGLSASPVASLGPRAVLTRMDIVYTLLSMDLTFELHGQVFEWDIEKAALNHSKHHVTFEKASEVFFDPFMRLLDATDAEECRDAAIGFTDDCRLLVVVHLLVRSENVIRIISARPATPSEWRTYEHY
ncbi:MAG: BrnT family toxin [Acidobacteriota bacterium]